MPFGNILGPSTSVLILDLMVDLMERTRNDVQAHMVMMKDKFNAEYGMEYARKVDTGDESIIFWCELLTDTGILEKASSKPATYRLNSNVLISDDDEGLMILRRDVLE